MTADLIKNIVHDKMLVNHLMGPGVDPHLYKASQGDLKTLQEANIIVYNGLHLEGKMTQIFEKLSKLKSVIAVSDYVDQDKILMDDEYKTLPDPHIWFNVELWASSLNGLAEQVCTIDPTNCDLYKENARSYKLELDSLHNYTLSELEKIPLSNRILITAHDAFKYFGKAYNIQVRGLQGISTLSEFGLKDRIELVDFIIENKIHAVFVESSVSQKNILAIVEACNQKGHEVTIGHSLYSDAMGPEGSPEGTYIGMVKSNVKSIVDGLMGLNKKVNEN
jgi:manganese/zinc/iron transport system substrate-binding protein